MSLTQVARNTYISWWWFILSAGCSPRHLNIPGRTLIHISRGNCFQKVGKMYIAYSYRPGKGCFVWVHILNKASGFSLSYCVQYRVAWRPQSITRVNITLRSMALCGLQCRVIAQQILSVMCLKLHFKRCRHIRAKLDDTIWIFFLLIWHMKIKSRNHVWLYW